MVICVDARRSVCKMLMYYVTLIAICQFVACESDRGTTDIPQQQKDITFEITGSRTIQIWSEGKLTLRAITKSGEKPQLTAGGVMDNAWFLDNGNATGVFEFCPTKNQIGNYTLTITAITNTENESLAVHLTVVDQISARKDLIPVARGNRWIYQSVHNRLNLDTVEIEEYLSVGGRVVGTGIFYPTLGMLDSGVVLAGDSILSSSSGLQFLIPDHIPETIEVSSRGACYIANLTREIEWMANPTIVPAGRFAGCFKFTSLLSRSGGSLGTETIAEEVFIKPGVGIVKIAQIKSSEGGGGCSSRWELLGWTIH